jgi:hypothetical protein
MKRAGKPPAPRGVEHFTMGNHAPERSGRSRIGLKTTIRLEGPNFVEVGLRSCQPHQTTTLSTRAPVCQFQIYPKSLLRLLRTTHSSRGKETPGLVLTSIKSIKHPGLTNQQHRLYFSARNTRQQIPGRSRPLIKLQAENPWTRKPLIRDVKTNNSLTLTP